MAIAAKTPSQSAVVSSHGAIISRIVGIACIVGYGLDLAIVAMPFAPGEISWRLTFLSEMGERGIVLLFGIALIMLSGFETRVALKRFGLFALALGVAFVFSSLASVKDTLTLQSVSQSRIDDRAAQIQSQIEDNYQNNAELKSQVTREQLNQSFNELNAQAQSAKQSVQSRTVRQGLMAISNLLVVGIAIISLGRYGMRVRKG